MVFNKKGQGLSLNVIIIAALALIVLVVLAVIFTSRAAETEGQLESVSGPTMLKLSTLKISYGECHPNTAREAQFLKDYEAAADADAEGGYVEGLKEDIANCKVLEEDNCKATDYCAWD